MIVEERRSNSDPKTVENENEYRKSIFLRKGCPSIKRGCPGKQKSD